MTITSFIFLWAIPFAVSLGMLLAIFKYDTDFDEITPLSILVSTVVTIATLIPVINYFMILIMLVEYDHLFGFFTWLNEPIRKKK